MSDKKIAIVAIITAALLGSAVAAVAKKGLEEIPPFSLSFFRLLVASICVLPFFLKTNNKLFTIKKLTLVSLFGTANIIFFVLGVYLTTANISSVIYAGVPLLAAVVLYIFFREKISVPKQLGIITGFLGVILITFLPILEKTNPFSGNLVGNILLILAIISWAFYSVFTKKKQSEFSPFIITTVFIFITTLALFPFFLWDLYVNSSWITQIGLWGIFSVFYLAVVITVINYNIIQYAIKHGGPVLAGTMFYILPVFGFIINFFLLGELLTPAFIFGSILALVGTYLVVRN